MAAVHGHSSDGNDIPLPFRHAIDALRSAHVRREVEIAATPPPKRLASHAFALEASVVVDDEELASGRLILLHEPEGQDAWQGTFRFVTLAQAELEPEMATDPLLPEVTWSWLTGALDAQHAAYTEPSGTVSQSSSHYFGGLSERAGSTRIEIRASWTPREGAGGVPDTAAHFAAWCDLLCASAGLPPAVAEHGSNGISVVPLPKRRN